MPLMIWDASFSVNVKEIDNQHMKLMEMLNQLHDAMKIGKGKDAIGPLIKNLVKYTETHFALEERYFEKFRYEEASSHKLAHQVFIDKVSAFQDDFTSGKSTLTMEIMSFLKDWLVSHIKGTDKRYSKCFNEHGLY